MLPLVLTGAQVQSLASALEAVGAVLAVFECWAYPAIDLLPAMQHAAHAIIIITRYWPVSASQLTLS